MTSDATPSLEYIFHPRSIAVCGAFTRPDRWWLKEYYIDPFVQGGYQGRLYLVDPRGGEIAGFPIYRSLADVPRPVDQVICCIAGPKTPELMEECRSIGAKVVQIFTAGFAETGEPENIALQETVVGIARSGGMRIIGPNCMGLYYPGGGMSFCTNFPTEPGPIGLLCQSGGNTTYITRLAADRGLRFSKVVSFGNASDVNECDLLEYLGADLETKIIAAYVEGTRHGARFLEALTRAASAKPVVFFKGGYTEGGGRATASHTGALAGTDNVWDGLLRQAGAIRVYSVEEMVDMLMALLHMKPPPGMNVCAVGNGGGSSVLATDECERAGLTMPPIPVETRERLKAFIPLQGSMLRNPIDGGFLIAMHNDGTFEGEPVPAWEDAVKGVSPEAGDGTWGQFLEIIEDWRDIDMAVFHYSIDINPITITEWRMGSAVGLMVAGAKACRLPTAIVLQMIANEGSAQAAQGALRLCKESGLPVFLSLRGAARAIRRLIDYNGEQPGMVARVQGNE